VEEPEAGVFVVEMVKEDAVKVTPTARQSCSAASLASVKSFPVQELAIQVAVLDTKEGVLQRQVSSEGLQLPTSALAMQGCEH
jgi:hypothetical protein